MEKSSCLYAIRLRWLLWHLLQFHRKNYELSWTLPNTKIEKCKYSNEKKILWIFAIRNNTFRTHTIYRTVITFNDFLTLKICYVELLLTDMMIFMVIKIINLFDKILDIKLTVPQLKIQFANIHSLESWRI